MMSFWLFFLLTLNIFITSFSSVSIVKFEQENVNWGLPKIFIKVQ